jgi:hypothetical protein
VFSRVAFNIPAAVPLVMWHKLATLVSRNHGRLPRAFSKKAVFLAAGKNLVVENTLKQIAIKLSIVHESFPEEEGRCQPDEFAKRRADF